MQDDTIYTTGMYLTWKNADTAGQGATAVSGAVFISGARLWFIGQSGAELISSG